MTSLTWYILGLALVTTRLNKRQSDDGSEDPYAMPLEDSSELLAPRPVGSWQTSLAACDPGRAAHVHARTALRSDPPASEEEAQ